MKRLLSTLKQKWPEYLLEILVLIIGIYGAFTLDNWNENRKERKNEKVFLLHLKHELELDTAALSQRMLEHQGINQRLREVLTILNNNQPINQKEKDLISYAIPDFTVLTTVYKDIGKNNALIASGALENISTELNNAYLKYLERTQSNNEIVNKLGEQLQRVSLSDVNPYVDLIYTEDSSRAEFDIQELRKCRPFKNAINRSFYYRDVHISWSKDQIQLASDLLNNINKLLGEK